MPPRVAVTYAAIFNFIGAFISLKVAATVGKGIVDSRRDHDDDRLRRPHRRHRLEPGHVVLRPAVVSSHALIGGLVGARSPPTAPSAILGEGLLGKVVVPAIIAPILAFVVAGARDHRGLLDRRLACARGRSIAATGSARSCPAACSRSPTARTTRRRRWASSRWRSSPTATSPADNFHVPTGSWSARRRRSRSGPTRAAGGSSDDGQPDHQDGPGAGLRRAGRGRGGDPRRVARRLPAVDHPRDLRRRHGRRRGQARLGGPLGRRGQHRRSRGSSRSRRRPRSARSSTA